MTRKSMAALRGLKLTTEVAKLFQVANTTWHYWIKDGIVPSPKEQIGKRWYYTAEQVEEIEKLFKE